MYDYPILDIHGGARTKRVPRRCEGQWRTQKQTKGGEEVVKNMDTKLSRSQLETVQE